MPVAACVYALSSRLFMVSIDTSRRQALKLLEYITSVHRIKIRQKWKLFLVATIVNKKFRISQIFLWIRGVNKSEITQIYSNLNKTELYKTSSSFADASLHDVQINLKESSRLFTNSQKSTFRVYGLLSASVFKLNICIYIIQSRYFVLKCKRKD